MRTLKTFVHVHDQAGITHVFGPGDEVPQWAQDAITNPKVWAEQSAPSSEIAQSSDGEAPVEPPRSGKGSGPKVWADFAQAHDIEVSDDAKRDDIIASLVDAGVIEAE